MNRLAGKHNRGNNPYKERRRSHEEREEIIKVPAFDNSDLIEKFKLTLVGRMFHADGRSVEALLKHMPKRRIWDVENRVRGINLGNNKFQFDFENEEDLEKVLQKRPCHFNKWSFSLERWIPTIKEDFPNTMAFWAVVEGVPSHYRKIETYQSVGKALGVYDKADVEGGRVRIFVNCDNPLTFECKVGFDNGDVVKVTITYEDLHRHCFTCKRISHEEGTCPELTDTQRELNRIKRIEQKVREERATREAFSVPQRKNMVESTTAAYSREDRGRDQRRETQISSSSHRVWNNEKVNSRDLRNKLQERKEYHPQTVWNRLDKLSKPENSRNRERFHPYYQHSYGEPREKMRDTASSSEWRARDPDARRQIYPKRNYEDKDPRERAIRSNPRNRGSPDSQRTISDNFRRSPRRPTYKGRSSRSPPSRNMEWKPVSKDRARDENRGERTFSSERTRITEPTNTDHAKRVHQREQERQSSPSGKTMSSEAFERRKEVHKRTEKEAEREESPVRETEEERTRRIRGKAIVVESNDKQTSLETRALKGALQHQELALDKIPENQVYCGKNLNNSQTPGENINVHPVKRALLRQEPEMERNETEETREQGLAEDQQSMSEEEMERFMEQYASVDTEMDADMIEADDLLDDLEDEEVIVPETQEAMTQNKKDDSKRGAIGGERAIEEIQNKQNSTQRPGNERVMKQQKAKPYVTSAYKRRGARSPDPKGLAASKKLASMGRASPKGKMVKSGRLSAIREAQTSVVPRTGVYPSAVKSRKFSSVSGSVGSQKPPSTRI